MTANNKRIRITVVSVLFTLSALDAISLLPQLVIPGKVNIVPYATTESAKPTIP